MDGFSCFLSKDLSIYCVKTHAALTHIQITGGKPKSELIKLKWHGEEDTLAFKIKRKSDLSTVNVTHTTTFFLQYFQMYDENGNPNMTSVLLFVTEAGQGALHIKT